MRTPHGSPNTVMEVLRLRAELKAARGGECLECAEVRRDFKDCSAELRELEEIFASLTGLKFPKTPKTPMHIEESVGGSPSCSGLCAIFPSPQDNTKSTRSSQDAHSILSEDDDTEEETVLMNEKRATVAPVNSDNTTWSRNCRMEMPPACKVM